MNVGWFLRKFKFFLWVFASSGKKLRNFWLIMKLITRQNSDRIVDVKKYNFCEILITFEVARFSHHFCRPAETHLVWKFCVIIEILRSKCCDKIPTKLSNEKNIKHFSFVHCTKVARCDIVTWAVQTLTTQKSSPRVPTKFAGHATKFRQNATKCTESFSKIGDNRPPKSQAPSLHI